MIWWILCEV